MLFKFFIALIVVFLAGYVYRQIKINKNIAKKNKLEGVAFLTENKSKDGVQCTESGLQFLVLKEGAESQHPSRDDKVTVHYHGTLIDGTVFDSSVDRGETIDFYLNQVIPGWTEGLQLMVVGEKTRFFIPSELAYGDNPAGSITPGSTLIFDVELFAINP